MVFCESCVRGCVLGSVREMDVVLIARNGVLGSMRGGILGSER